jgi:hypothetical protein
MIMIKKTLIILSCLLALSSTQAYSAINSAKGVVTAINIIPAQSTTIYFSISNMPSDVTTWFYVVADNTYYDSKQVDRILSMLELSKINGINVTISYPSAASGTAFGSINATGCGLILN